MNENNFNQFGSAPGAGDPFGQQSFGYDIPKFPIGQIKRIAHGRLKGHIFELLPAFMIYFILMMVPMSIVYVMNNMESMESVQTIMNAGGNAASLANAASATASTATKDPLVSVLGFYILIVTGPFSIGLCSLMLRFLRGRDHGAGVIFEGFKRPLQGILIALALDIISTLCATAAAMPVSIGLLSGSVNSLAGGSLMSIVLLILVIIIRLRLQMSYYLATDDRNLSFFACLTGSWALMKGNVKRYFLLILSFIGWLILAALPFGFADGFYSVAVQNGFSDATTWGVTGVFVLIGLIIYIPVMLYIQLSEAVFYSNLSGNFTTVNRTPEPPAPEQISPEL